MSKSSLHLKIEGREVMQEFIESTVNQLGIEEDQAKSATGGLLKLLKNQRGGSEAQTLIAKLPALKV
jgi:uncharacterized protein (DUF2267 family)